MTPWLPEGLVELPWTGAAAEGWDGAGRRATGMISDGRPGANDCLDVGTLPGLLILADNCWVGCVIDWLSASGLD